MKNEIHIDPEFRDLLPTPSSESLQELERSLLTEGCREPLIAWRHDGKLALLDGHTRHVICTAHGIKCKVLVKTEKEIPDRDAAIDWIDRNQLSRRNLNQDQFALVLGRIYNRQKQQGARSDLTFRQSGGKSQTAERLAQEHGVSPRTVERAGQFAEAVEKAKEQDPDIEQKVAQGEVTRAEVMEKAKPPVAKPKQATTPKDPDGHEIPEHLVGIFATQAQFERFAQTLSTLKGQVKQAIEANPVAWSQFSENAFRAALSKAHDLLTLSGPHVVCSYCGGSESEKCRGCKGSGFLSKAQARCAPKEMRP